VPADTVVKDLPSPGTQEREDVLEVGGGTRGPAERCRVEWASPRSEEEHSRDAATDLEAPRAEVLVGNAVAGEVEHRPQEERRDA